MYIGRFAPSPTGSLHLGSLFTALASFLDARANQGKWLLRIDDSDTPRNVRGSTQDILDTLHRFGLEWDTPIAYQSKNQTVYDALINQLIIQKQAYPCTCSRKTLASYKSHVYPQLCRHKLIKENQPYALRIKSQDIEIKYNDYLQGLQIQQLASQQGDFIINRKDNIIAYQLAVVIDDYLQNITHIMRGIDLLHSTPKQIFLQQLLNYPTPSYCHLPVITGPDGTKLSKQSSALAIKHQNPEKTLILLLKLLNQNPPNRLETTSTKEIIDWAIDHWNPNPLKKIRAIFNNID